MLTCWGGLIPIDQKWVQISSTFKRLKVVENSLLKMKHTRNCYKRKQAHTHLEVSGEHRTL